MQALGERILELLSLRWRGTAEGASFPYERLRFSALPHGSSWHKAPLRLSTFGMTGIAGTAD